MVKPFRYPSSISSELAIALLRDFLSSTVGSAVAVMAKDTATEMVSVVVGCRVGERVGYRLGTGDGSRLGTGEGCVGTGEGIGLGLSEGLMVGRELGAGTGVRLGPEVGFGLGMGVGMGTGVGTDGDAVGVKVGTWPGQSTSSCILHLPLPVNCRTHPPPPALAAELSTVKAPSSRSWLSMTMYLVVVMSASARTVRAQENRKHTSQQ
jgi:hypothetical protein